MSNQFKILDTLFPCGKDRLFGEVVSVSVRLVDGVTGNQYSSYRWKRKAWYVNASVNAWHLHRGLCREFSNENSWFTSAELASIKKDLAKLVLVSYLYNYLFDDQYNNFCLCKLDKGYTVHRDISGNETISFDSMTGGLSEYVRNMLACSLLRHFKDDSKDVQMIAWESIPYSFVPLEKHFMAADVVPS